MSNTNQDYLTIGKLREIIKDLPDDIIVGYDIWDGSAVEINGAEAEVVGVTEYRNFPDLGDISKVFVIR